MKQPLVRKLSHFTRLAPADIEMLERISEKRVRHFEGNADIVEEGEAPAYINLIIEGWACRYKTLEDGRRQIVAFFLPGDMCDLNVFILKQMDHSIAAITPVVVSEIGRDAFEEMMHGHPRITQALWWETLVTAAVQREWTVNLGQRSAPERMAHLFCELFIRMRAAGLTDGNSCEFPLTQSQLGETIGMSLVHVNRTLQDLRAADLVELANRRLTIIDFPALKRMAMFNPNYLHLDHEGSHLDSNQ